MGRSGSKKLRRLLLVLDLERSRWHLTSMIATGASRRHEVEHHSCHLHSIAAWCTGATSACVAGPTAACRVLCTATHRAPCKGPTIMVAALSWGMRCRALWDFAHRGTRTTSRRPRHLRSAALEALLLSRRMP
jgi:hypothetical protein